MGKGNWFSSVKKVLGPDFKQKKDQELRKKWFGKHRAPDTVSSAAVAVAELLPPPPTAPVRMEEVDLINGQAEERVDVSAVAVNIQPITESLVLDTTATVQPVGAVQFGGRSREDAVAITIQKTFRGYKEGVADFEEASQVDVPDGMADRETPGHEYPKEYAGSLAHAVSDPLQKDQNVRG